jgi:hypothetical protein
MVQFKATVPFAPVAVADAPVTLDGRPAVIMNGPFSVADPEAEVDARQNGLVDHAVVLIVAPVGPEKSLRGKKSG